MKTRTVAGLATLVTSAALFVGSTAPAAHASVLGSCGTVSVTAPPPSIVKGADASDNHIHAFAEQANLSLPSALGVDITPPASFPTLFDTAASLTPGNIPAGTAVDSFYVHTDTVNSAAVSFSATLTFSTDIVGLIVLDANLNASDGIVGLPTVTYFQSKARGLEVLPHDDRVTMLSARSIQLNLFANTVTDDIRVITAAAGAAAPGSGYRFVASDGGIFSFGNQPFLGSMGGKPLNQPMVGGVNTCANDGYWTVASDGGIFTFGTAQFFGSTGALKLNKPIVAIAPTNPSGNGNNPLTQKGYWLFASDGGVFAFGDAPFLGSMGAVKLNKPVVGGASNPVASGYWMVATDGGIFTFGAPFFGSTGAMTLNQPIVGMAPTLDGLGYFLVAADGGIFTFGDAAFHGSTGALKLNKPIVGMKLTPSGNGYWLIASDGGVFAFGDAVFYGSTGAIVLNKPIVGAM
jgi:hypothetical protein